MQETVVSVSMTLWYHDLEKIVKEMLVSKGVITEDTMFSIEGRPNLTITFGAKVTSPSVVTGFTREEWESENL